MDKEVLELYKNNGLYKIKFDLDYSVNGGESLSIVCRDEKTKHEAVRSTLCSIDILIERLTRLREQVANI